MSITENRILGVDNLFIEKTYGLTNNPPAAANPRTNVSRAGINKIFKKAVIFR